MKDYIFDDTNVDDLIDILNKKGYSFPFKKSHRRWDMPFVIFFRSLEFYLKSKNVYDKTIINLTNHNVSIKKYVTIKNDIPSLMLMWAFIAAYKTRESVFMVGFLWGPTEEGIRFWENLDSDMFKYLSKIEESLYLGEKIDNLKNLNL